MRHIFCAALAGLIAFVTSAAPAECLDVPSMSSYFLSWNELITSEVHEGVVMEIRGNHIFLLNEKPFLILQETEINGIPAGKASNGVKKGNKVRVNAYRLKDRSFFAADINIIK